MGTIDLLLIVRSTPHRLSSLGTGMGGAALALLAVLGQQTKGDKDEQTRVVQFGRDIRPILSERCFECHGPDAGTRQAGLRLDLHASASEERDGIRAIVPGDLEASELWRRVSNSDPDEVMPPPHGRKGPLGAHQIQLFKDWIMAGAKYEEHWSFVPAQRPALPDSEDLSKNPIDQFILAKLQDAGVASSTRERPEILLRRLMFDLTGLPPTPEETQAFLGGLETQDFDTLWSSWIRRLFGEEPYRSRYAERMTSPWLDQARYGDTNGIHTDAGRQIWPWRDWVLTAFRDNMPFDQFLTEQLAGDLLPEASVDQRIASGFNRNHIITDEGGAIDEEYLVEYAVDRASTTGSVFLGLTMGCARCHDHKFDPISQEEFYRFYSFFNSNEEPGLYSQLPDPKRAFEPSIERPSPAQIQRGQELAEELQAERAGLEQESPESLAALAQFRSELPAELGLHWVASSIESAVSAGGAQMDITPEGTLLVSGTNPATDIHTLRLRTEAQDLRLIQLDALCHESFVNGSPGRSSNGNGMLTMIEVQAVSLRDPSLSHELKLNWAWADYAQDNDDYGVLRSFDRRHNTGWAIGGHLKSRDCSALFLSAEPFGFEGGTELIVKLSYETIWAGTVIGHVGLSLGQLSSAGLASLPLSQGPWYHAGPFELESASAAYDIALGLETQLTFDPTKEIEWGEQEPLRWRYQREFADGEVTALASGVNIHYLGREIYAPEARSLELSLGSDDGFALFVNGEQVLAREVPRGVQADQDRVAIKLDAGRNVLVLKVINTGGQAGFYYRALEAAERFPADLLSALVRPGMEDRHAERIAHAWRLSKSPEYRAGVQAIASLELKLEELEASIPRSMVMQQRATPRPSFVLTRGEYDKADPERPVEAGVPSFLGSAPSKGPDLQATRLDLAHWMTARDNPLVARVAVNRLWQLVFGNGLVQTSADFGYQGSWPSHPKLLDWLAVEFMESGWDTQHLLTLMVSSKVYKQSSQVRPDLHELDPGNRLLASYPRRRLDAEMIRDQALHVAGLLKEDFGGPSVKPYQPQGLWAEVAMPQSNTADFELGQGDELWRRSVYTYWKRACPPPSMLTFDAPTREECSVQRASTNTPLQALVLWNDEQFVEAARLLAQRTLLQAGDTDTRLASIFQRCTGRGPDSEELGLLRQALLDFQERYASSPDDAAALLAIGMAALATQLDPSELAAWTMLASAVLNLHASITQG